MGEIQYNYFRQLLCNYKHMKMNKKVPKNCTSLTLSSTSRKCHKIVKLLEKYKNVSRIYLFSKKACICTHIIHVLQFNKVLTLSADRTYVKNSCCSTAHFHRYLQAASVSHLQPIGFCFCISKKDTYRKLVYTYIFIKNIGGFGNQ